MAGYRGRLIFPFTASIARLSPAGTRADPDGAGPLTSGYNPVFREPRILENGGQVGTLARVELAAVKVPCQVEREHNKHPPELRMHPGGNTPRARLILVFHFQDLERLGLVDATTKEPLIQLGDRLVAIYDRAGTTLVETYPNPPGHFCIESQSGGFGFSTHRNLLLCTFEDRMTAADPFGA